MAVGCRYDGAPDWDGGAHCAASFQPGAEALGDALVDKFGGRYEGLACRPNTADPRKTSKHGDGSTIDWYPPGVVGSAAQVAVGNAAADWLAENHERFGVQLIIWDREDWSCGALDDVPGVGEGDGWTPYGGPHPHDDHEHIELTDPAAASNTAETYDVPANELTEEQVKEIVKAIKTASDAEIKTMQAQGRLDRGVARRQGALTRIAIAKAAGGDDPEAAKELALADAEITAAEKF